MVLPIPVYAIKGVGLVQGIVCVAKGFSTLDSVTPDQTRSSSVVSTEVLFGSRLVMLLVSSILGVFQLAERGVRIFTFFTVWNWWLLMAYFALATISSYRVMRQNWKGQRRRSRRRLTFSTTESVSSDWIDRLAVTLFQMLAPMTLTVSIVTWLVLVPMLMANPDPVAVEKWARFMYSNISYMQHGVNTLMVFSDLAISNIPYLLRWAIGWVSLWVSAYAIWSTIFFVLNGTFIYPFLDAHRPHAWVAYSALYFFVCITVLLCAGAAQLRDYLLEKYSYKQKSK